MAPTLPPRTLRAVQPVSSLHIELLERARQRGEDVASSLDRAAARSDTTPVHDVLVEHTRRMDRATQRLATALMRLGVRPDEGASVHGHLDRAVLAINARLPDGDARVLEQCGRMERAAAAAVSDAMSLPWPKDVLPEVAASYATVRQCVAEMAAIPPPAG